MLQIVMPEARSVEIRETEIPQVGKKQILIEMKRLGICGSDVQVYRGRHQYMSYPVVQGHEGAGVIAAVGSDVRTLQKGDRVTVRPQLSCKKCAPCQRGYPNVCEHLKVYGVHTDGMAVDFFLTDEEHVLKLHEGMSFDEGAMVEPTAVAVGTIRRCGPMPGKNVAVIGAGTIGNLVAQTAAALGANVLISDVNPRRIALAARCGIKNGFVATEQPLTEAIRHCFGQGGADVIIDCAASPQGLQDILAAARPASKIAIVGNYEVPVSLELPLLQRRQIDLVGVMMYLHADFAQAIALIGEKKIKATALISHHLPIRQFLQGYEIIEQKPQEVMKVMLCFEEEQENNADASEGR